MLVDSEEPLLAVVDRIYESIERPELWPETIYAIGEFLGGRRNFWGLDPSAQGPGLLPARNTHTFETGCHGTFFLSRADLQALDQYEQEFGDLIIRFLENCFLEHSSVSERRRRP
jgi:hypothetical protein